MKLKWNRVSFVLAFVMGLLILAVFIFGQVYFLDPIKQRADRAAQQVEEQTSLKAEYPPEQNLLDDYRQAYEETWGFLPEGEKVNQELVALERTAAEENVTVQQIARVGEPQAIEGLDESYRKSTYEVEMTSNTAGNMQRLVERLEGLERIWNIYSFGFEKLAEESFSGTFTFELFYYVAGSEEQQ
ncbi:hypothetical protein [uncultured Trichococcus sp.]|uniref:hypothetical protein n=1 Tax=uncultured Trichococcus sp. TaxID=189665 RepID=UPI002A18A1E4|nr:hypothetical protein [uncultured Trichococcus sp.]